MLQKKKSPKNHPTSHHTTTAKIMHMCNAEKSVVVNEEKCRMIWETALASFCSLAKIFYKLPKHQQQRKEAEYQKETA